MATYNGERYVHEQIQSILIQLGPEDELIVSDDQSVDATVEIVRSFADPRIRLLRNSQNLGYTKNFEVAIRQARGDLIMLSDQDDYWLPNRIAVTVAALDHADFVLCDAEVVDADLNMIHPSHFRRHHTRTGFIRNWVATRYSGCAMAFRAELLKAALPFPARSDLCSHDYWLALIAEFYFKTKLIKQPLFLYRRHDETATTAGESSPFSLGHKLSVRAYVLPRVLARWARVRQARRSTRVGKAAR